MTRGYSYCDRPVVQTLFLNFEGFCLFSVFSGNGILHRQIVSCPNPSNPSVATPAFIHDSRYRKSHTCICGVCVSATASCTGFSHYADRQHIGKVINQSDLHPSLRPVVLRDGVGTSRPTPVHAQPWAPLLALALPGIEFPATLTPRTAAPNAPPTLRPCSPRQQHASQSHFDSHSCSSHARQ